MKKQTFCQSCGMPLTYGLMGTNADGIRNEDYCSCCCKDGKSTPPVSSAICKKR